MLRTTAIEQIINYFTENEDIFNECIEELDSYNGYLGDDRYYEMKMIDELYHDTDATELLNRAYFGYDADSYITDSYGEKHHDSFNPNRDYFTYNGYGNLVSADYKDYSAFLDDYAVEAMSDHRNDIYTISEHEELEALFDALDEAEAA